MPSKVFWFGLIFLATLAACVPSQRRAAKNLARYRALYPMLFEASRVDSFEVERLDTFILEGYDVDTSFVRFMGGLIDSFEVNQRRLKAKISVLESREMGTRTVRLRITSPPDTVVVRDTIIHYRETPAPPCPPALPTMPGPGAPWWQWLLALIVAAYGAWRMLKK